VDILIYDDCNTFYLNVMIGGDDILEGLRDRWWKRVLERGLEDFEVHVTVRGLSPVEAIGYPSRTDFPLFMDREVMIQADFMGFKGQAFTDTPMDYVGDLKSICSLPLSDSRFRAVLVATINAFYRYLGLVEGTVHCRDMGPELCAKRIASLFTDLYSPETRILVIGYQPSIIHHLSLKFRNIRVTDMDSNNIGRVKDGIMIEPHTVNRDAMNWSDVVLATGSSIVNGSINEILMIAGDKVIFYGVTIASAAYEFGLRRLCFESS